MSDNENTIPSWSLRFRFRMARPFPLGDDAVTLTISDRKLFLRRDPSRMAVGSEWFSIDAHGFPTEQNAQAFALDLKAALTLVGMRLSLGIDAGEDKFSGGPGKILIDKAAEEGITLRPTTHGIDVYPFGGNLQFPNATAALTVNSSVDRLLRHSEWPSMKSRA
ncbi:hypothetical protein [Pelagibacterium luteolum]|uniref:Uncharacterized protein n=1 Tax=Pelagibacterium luteolum TaxID=440168 RepID=A0A1G8AIS2_9HYPH|nr:hypothetical protein [Pelagibacterium luteolum]SDH20821.1 hypothetical protein SAMN04487974_1318 [Pelagibacterium luteolum]